MRILWFFKNQKKFDIKFQYIHNGSIITFSQQKTQPKHFDSNHKIVDKKVIFFCQWKFWAIWKSYFRKHRIVLSLAKKKMKVSDNSLFMKILSLTILMKISIFVRATKLYETINKCFPLILSKTKYLLDVQPVYTTPNLLNN